MPFPPAAWWAEGAQFELHHELSQKAGWHALDIHPFDASTLTLHNNIKAQLINIGDISGAGMESNAGQ